MVGISDKQSNKKRRFVGIISFFLISMMVASACLFWVGSDGVGNYSQKLYTDNFSSTMVSSTSIILSQKNSTMTADEDLFLVDMQVQIQGRLVTSEATGVSGAKVILSIIMPDGSTTVPDEGSIAIADESGSFFMTYVPKEIGSYNFTASFAGDDINLSSEEFFSVLVVEPTTVINLARAEGDSADGENVVLGEEVHISGQLQVPDIKGVPEANVSVTVTLPNGAAAVPEEGAYVITDDAGNFSISYVPTASGTYNFTASFAGNDQYQASGSTSILLDVESPSTTTEKVPTVTESIATLRTVYAGTYNFKVVNNVVKRADGSTAYVASSFTTALQWAVNQVGKVVYVPAGTYKVTSSITVKSGVTLVGDGDEADGTVLQFTSASKLSAKLYMNNVNNVVLKQFRVIGYGNIEVWAKGVTVSNIKLYDITWYKTSSIQPACFMTWVSSKGTITGLSLYRCQALEAGCIGFGLLGDKANVDTVRTLGGWIKAAYFEDCKAYKCGITSRFNAYVCGFDLDEGVNVDGLKLVRCEASNNYMDGFHFEKWPYVKNTVFTDCKAYSNGVTRGSGFGWIYNLAMGHQVTRTNCIGAYNASGLVRT